MKDEAIIKLQHVLEQNQTITKDINSIENRMKLLFYRSDDIELQSKFVNSSLATLMTLQNNLIVKITYCDGI